MKLALKNLSYLILDILQTITVAFGFFAVIYLFLIQPHQVRGDSMLPSFHNSDYLITNKVLYTFREPQRGDVIIFKFPPMPKEEYIKRIIGMPNEEVEIRDGFVIIYNSEHPNGFVLDEPYLEKGTRTAGKTAIPDETRIRIPEDQFVVMGDNRSRSSDSREWGFVPRENFVGKGWIRYWPPEAMAFIPHPDY